MRGFERLKMNIENRKIYGFDKICVIASDIESLRGSILAIKYAIDLQDVEIEGCSESASKLDYLDTDKYLFVLVDGWYQNKMFDDFEAFEKVRNLKNIVHVGW